MLLLRSLCFLSAAAPLMAHEGHDHEVSSAIWQEHQPDEFAQLDIQQAFSLQATSVDEAADTVVLDQRITAWIKSDGSTGQEPPFFMAAPVPEPPSLALFGVLGLWILRRRR